MNTHEGDPLGHYRLGLFVKKTKKPRSTGAGTANSSPVDNVTSGRQATSEYESDLLPVLVASYSAAHHQQPQEGPRSDAAGSLARIFDTS